MNPKINWHPTRLELRKFGAVVLIGFGVIGGILLWRGRIQTAQMIWIVSGPIGLITLAVPALGLPFYWVWMTFGFVVGSVLSRVVLALIFYGVLTPLAVFFRFTGRDALRRRKPSPARDTYWVQHPDIEKKNYQRLF